MNCPNTNNTLGLLVPPTELIGLTSSPLFEDKIPMLTIDQIVAIAKSGEADMRSTFDKSYVLDQKSHGSCCGHGCATALTKARVRRGQAKQLLSGAYVYSKINGGRDRGGLLEDGKNAIERYGSCLLTTAGWDQIYPNQIPANADSEASRFKGFECYAVKTLQGLWTALALKFDLVNAVHVGRSFSKLNQLGVAGIDSGPGNHCTSSDGLTYENNQLTALSQNSWNVTFGEDGRMKLVQAHFQETMKYHVFFAVRSTTDDPNAPTPPDIMP